MIANKIICITGIDTDIGKTIVTGLVAKYLSQRGYRVITQKMSQTGCVGFSDDIRLHRQIMGVELGEEDERGLTCPYVFAEPCSPHLAAALEKTAIDLNYITECTEELAKKYDVVVMEGVGGLMVPLTSELLLVDYLNKFDYKHILVSSSRLGSINHTLSALEMLKNRKIEVLGIAYNLFAQTSEVITQDTREVLKRYLGLFSYPEQLVDIDAYQPGVDCEIPDFSQMLKYIGEE